MRIACEDVSTDWLELSARSSGKIWVRVGESGDTATATISPDALLAAVQDVTGNAPRIEPAEGVAVSTNDGKVRVYRNAVRAEIGVDGDLLVYNDRSEVKAIYHRSNWTRAEILEGAHANN